MTARKLKATEVGIPLFDVPEAREGDVFQLSSHRRARQALEFALGAEGPEFNVFVLGPDRGGRMTATVDFLQQRMLQRPPPDDWIYLANFSNPEEPQPIALTAGQGQRFQARGLPIVGDDIKSQEGSTIVHRVLTRLFLDRGVRLDRTYQLNFGGNTDFLNMLERERLESKKISKTNAVTSQLDNEMPADDIHIGPSDYVPWLLDQKWAYIRLEGTTFGNVPLNVELKMEVWDSPNSAGVVIDAIRCCRLALDRGITGALGGPSAYFMKSPPTQYTDDQAREMVETFVTG